MSKTNWVFSVLQSHAKVDELRFFLNQAREHPEHYPPIVASIAEQFFEHDRISRKQLEVICKIARQYKILI
jgi:hypothetical protein